MFDDDKSIKNVADAYRRMISEDENGGYTPISFRDISEKGSGWVHEITFRTAKGVFSILDDTDSVEVHANKPNVVTPEGAAQLWHEYGFGTSSFPTKQVPKGLPEDSPNGLSTKVWTGGGEDFSQLS